MVSRKNCFFFPGRRRASQKKRVQVSDAADATMAKEATAFRMRYPRSRDSTMMANRKKPTAKNERAKSIFKKVASGIL